METLLQLSLADLAPFGRKDEVFDTVTLSLMGLQAEDHRACLELAERLHGSLAGPSDHWVSAVVGRKPRIRPIATWERNKSAISDRNDLSVQFLTEKIDDAGYEWEGTTILSLEQASRVGPQREVQLSVVAKRFSAWARWAAALDERVTRPLYGMIVCLPAHMPVDLMIGGSCFISNKDENVFDSALRAYWMEVPRRQVWQLGDEYYRRFIRAGNPLSVVSPTLLKSRGRATKTLEETIASNANYGVLWPVRDGYSLWYLPRQSTVFLARLP